MNKGIIYLIQPTELIGTHRYKIGSSKNTELDRIKKGYKKGTRYIVIMECNNPFVLEKQIKKLFNEKFKLIAGYEYFEGNEKNIKEEFQKLANEHNIIYNDEEDDKDKDDDEDDDGDDEDDEDYSYMTHCFQNYNEDEEFGGKKQLVKIHVDDCSIDIEYMYNKSSSTIRVGDYDTSYVHNEYLKKLVKYKIIEDKKIYDLNDRKFINNLVKYMKKTKIYCSENINAINNFFINNTFTGKYIKILKYFKNNTIINNNIFCDTIFGDNGDIVRFDIEIYSDNDEECVKNIYVTKINKIYFDDQFLRCYIPYRLSVGEKYFYIENRDYQRFDLEGENIKDDNYRSIFLFTDNCTPWCKEDGNYNLKKIINKYIELTNGKEVLNLSKDTKYLINIFK